MYKIGGADSNGNPVLEEQDDSIDLFGDFERELGVIEEEQIGSAKVKQDGQRRMDAPSDSNVLSKEKPKSQKEPRFRRLRVKAEIITELDSRSIRMDHALSIDDIHHKLFEIYGNKESLISDGFSGQTLENRIIAKAYSIALIPFIETLAVKVHKYGLVVRAPGEGENGIKLTGHLFGRADGTNQLDTSTIGSRVQATCLSLNGTPFIIVDAGNNSELTVVQDGKLYNLGYYQNGSATRDNLATVKIGFKNRDTEAYVTTKSVLNSNTKINQSSDSIYKIKSSSSELDDYEARIVNHVLENLVNNDLSREDDELRKRTVSLVQELRGICGLDAMSDIQSNDMLKQLGELHKLTTSSLEK